MFIQYTASRSLRSGITAGSVQIFDFELKANDIRPKPQAKTVQSLSGLHQTIFHRSEIHRSLVTIPTKDSLIELQFLEFLDSSVDGSTFIIDLTGYQASPDNPMPAMLSPFNYSQTLVSRIFTQFAFTIRQL